MKKLSVLCLPFLLLVGCGAPPPDNTAFTASTDVSPASQEVESSASSASSASYEEAQESSSASSHVDMQYTTLVDQDYTPDMANVEGMDWLKAIGAVQLSTQDNVTGAKLHIHLSSGWSAIGMYVAEVKTDEAGNESPDENQFGTHLHFIDATWSGDGQRHLAADSNVGVQTEHGTDFVYDLSAVPVTEGDDGNLTASVPVDLESLLNDKGVYLGFAPSGYIGHITVTLESSVPVTVLPY